MVDGDAPESEPVAAPRSRAVDPRPARTRAAILAAIEQLPELAAEDVTVTTLVVMAGVSRSVFYTHFANLEALLTAVLEETATTAETPTGVGGATPRAVTTASLAGIVGHVDSRATFYTAALEWKASLGVQDGATRGYARRLADLMNRVRDLTPDAAIPEGRSADFAATFLAGGIIAALTEWLRSDRSISSAALVDELLALMPAWLVSDEAN